MHVLWHPRSWSLRRSLVLGRNGTSNFEGYLLLRLRRLCLSISISYVVSKTLSTAQVGFCTRTNLVIPYDWSRSRILVSDLPAYLQQSKTQRPSGFVDPARGYIHTSKWLFCGEVSLDVYLHGVIALHPMDATRKGIKVDHLRAVFPQLCSSISSVLVTLESQSPFYPLRTLTTSDELLTKHILLH